MYQQRSEPAAADLEVQGPWQPALEGAARDFAPRTHDRYAVVDDLEADRVVVVFDRWPQVDHLGHLVFTGDALVRDYPRARFQRLVDAQRQQAGQPAADRALRVGDVFWVRTGAEGRLERAVQWEILDVTGPARRAAHAAQLVAASPGLRTPAPEASGPQPQSSGRPASTPRTGAARPAV